jgi:hypothetical protein
MLWVWIGEQTRPAGLLSTRSF